MENQKVTVYLDGDFRCHAEQREGLIPFETDFFNGREELIEKYRAVPQGEPWTRADGAIFLRRDDNPG